MYKLIAVLTFILITSASGLSQTAYAAQREQAGPPQNPQAQAYCSGLTAEAVSTTGRTFRFTANAVTHDGVSLQKADFNFGDNTKVETAPPTDNTVVIQHEYVTKNSYTAKATLYFAGIQNQPLRSECSVTITNAPVPTSASLTNTGPGATLSIFGGVSALAALCHYLVRRRLLA